MPSLTLNKKEFDKLLGKKIPDETLKDRISMIGTDLESLDSNEINVEIFPNRPDMLSMQGFVRAMSTFLGLKKGLSKYEVKKSGCKLIVEKSVSKVRPYTACAIVKGLKFNDERIKEIIQIQEKLHITFGRNRRKAAIGIYPLEKIKFPVRFVGEDPKKIKFRPLESSKDMTGLQILSQHPAGREYGKLLEGMEKFPFFIDANNNVLSMPPIINSHDTGKITEDTKEVFIECSGFDFNVLKKCLNMIVTSLADMGGEIYSLNLEYPEKKFTSPNLSPEKMKVDIDFINKKLGLKLKQSELKMCLEKMGFGYEEGKALIPCYRADIMHPVDLVEDVAIAYGFENFEEEIPSVGTIGKESEMSSLMKKISYMLAGLGFLELNTYNLSSKEVQNKKMMTGLDLVELESSVSTDYTHLRGWMIPSLLETFTFNKLYEYPQNIFDMGTIFKKDPKSETGVEENTRLGVAMCSADANYTKIMQVFNYVMRMLGLEYEIKDTEHNSFIPGRVARISVGGKDVAYIGEISPDVLENFSLDMPIAAFELNLTELSGIINK